MGVQLSTMCLFQFMQRFNEPLGVVNVAAIGLFVMMVLKIIKSLTARSPYEHIPGPKPSSMLGMTDLIPNNAIMIYLKKCRLPPRYFQPGRHRFPFQNDQKLWACRKVKGWNYWGLFTMAMYT